MAYVSTDGYSVQVLHDNPNDWNAYESYQGIQSPLDTEEEQNYCLFFVGSIETNLTLYCKRKGEIGSEHGGSTIEGYYASTSRDHVPEFPTDYTYTGVDTPIAIYHYEGDSEETQYKQLAYRTNIPIFNSFEDATEYVESGDDSKATNQEMLHPVIYHFYVSNDGKVVSIKYDFENENECELKYTITSSTGGYDIDAIHGTVDLSWDNIENNCNWTIFGEFMTVCELTITGYAHNSPENPIFTLKGKLGREVLGGLKGETIAEVIIGESNGSTLEMSTNGEFTDKATDSDTDFDIDNTLGEYNSEGFGNTFLCTLEQLKNFASEIWAGGIFENLSLLNNSPIENIVSILRMPCTCPTSGMLPIKLGNYTSNVVSDVVTKNIVTVSAVAKKKIPFPKGVSGFLCYEPFTTLSFYLPFFGIVPMDAKTIMGNYVSIDYLYDVVVGSVTVMVYVHDGESDDKKAIVYQASSQCGIETPISGSNKAQVQAGIISSTLGAIGDVASGNIGGAIGEVGNIALHQNKTMTSGKPTSMTALLTPPHCHYIIKYPITYTPANFAHTVGYMCMTTYQLNNSKLKGFTVCHNVDTTFISATDEEKREIKSLLESGIYL